MVLVAARRQSLRQEVTRILCRYIADTPLHDGDRLPGQRDLADYLQVSRTVVREALSSLEGLGIIAIRAGDGAIVRNAALAAGEARPDVAEPQDLHTSDLIEFWSALYMGLPELICERATDEDVAGLRAVLTTMERKLHRGKTVLGEVQEFIWQLAMLSRNEIVLGLRPLRNEADRRGLLAQSSILGRPTAMAPQHLANHREMVDAISARDPERLRRVFREEFPLQIAGESGAPG